MNKNNFIILELLTTFRRFFLASILVGFVLTILLVVYLDAKLPSVETLRDVQLQIPLKIYSAEGKLF